ncbi:MAG TPA: hypothetical protein VF599_12420 [Pyrinomonadaceae bacterium]|jgi:hypothetical protein
MKSNLILNSPLWKTPERRALLDKTVQQSALELESEIKQAILKGPKTGRTYRRGRILKKAAAKNRGFYRGEKTSSRFKRVFKSLTDERFVVGFGFHRASKKGESPAPDTGALVNATRAQKTGEGRATVANGKGYGELLDNPEKLDRPFFKSTVEKFKEKFKQNLSDTIKENS